MEEVIRKLATVRKISNLLPIEGADFLELAIVDGWQCIVGVDYAFKVGDLAVYFEVDSVLPIYEDFEFLRKSCYVQRDWLQTPNNEGFRLRTIKLRKQLSQGFLVPLTTAYTLKNDPQWLPQEGEDLTELFGIMKWEPPLPANLAGIARGNFPTAIRKTDQERIQNIIRRVLQDPENMNATWEVTLKLDGSSGTFYHNEGKVGVCSRNLDLSLTQVGNTFIDMFNSLGLEHFLPDYGNIALQGEMMGPGIQGNRENLPNFKFFVFDVWDINTQGYVGKDRRKAIIEKLGLTHVPVIAESATLAELGCDTLQGMLAFAKRKSLNHAIAEGVVFKRTDGRFSFKVISNNYLLKSET